LNGVGFKLRTVLIKKTTEEYMVTHRIVAYLITLAVGYWVLTQAGKEKGMTQKIGKVIGWIIIAVSLAGPLCIGAGSLVCHAKGDDCAYNSSCPWHGHSMANCPDMGKGMMGGQAPAEEKPKAK
jgi:hypothetical protein